MLALCITELHKHGGATPVDTGSAASTAKHKADDRIPVHRRSNRPRALAQMLIRSHVRPVTQRTWQLVGQVHPGSHPYDQ
jgi:hypothetical protein